MLTELHVNQDKLEETFDKFVKFIALQKGEVFKSFRDSDFLNSQKGESYKYNIFKKAKNILDSKNWTEQDIGTGRIRTKVNQAVNARGNLIYPNQVGNFEKIESNTLEQTLFDFYKTRMADGKSFEKFRKEGLEAEIIAYLFFIKNNEKDEKYLPISKKSKIDEIINLQLGIKDFKISQTSNDSFAGNGRC